MDNQSLISKSHTDPLNVYPEGDGGEEAEDDASQDQVVAARVGVHDDPRVVHDLRVVNDDPIVEHEPRV